jgi:hypothetical protein
MKKLTQKNFCLLLIRFQTECDVNANIIATEAVEQFGLKRLHKALVEGQIPKRKLIK